MAMDTGDNRDESKRWCELHVKRWMLERDNVDKKAKSKVSLYS